MACNREEYSSPTNYFHTKSEIIGYFSIDEQRNYMPDCSSLLYYNPPKAREINLDLKQGVESTVHYSASVAEERLDFLLKWIKLNRTKIEAAAETDRWIQPNFVCPSGLISKLLCTPCDFQYNWAILAAKWRGTIYLYVDKTQKIPFDVDERLLLYGQKFEQSVLSEYPDQVPDPSAPLIQNTEFRCVYQSYIGNHKILFDHVTKGVCSKKQLTDPLPLENLIFIETKTSAIIEHPGKYETLRKFKLLNWWSRNVLSNTTKMLVGFRDEEGIVRELKTYSLDQMIEMGKPYWDPSTCMIFADDLLTMIAKSVANDCDKTVYRFQRTPNETFRTNEIIKGSMLIPSPENALLPAWYMEESEKSTK